MDRMCTVSAEGLAFLFDAVSLQAHQSQRTISAVSTLSSFVSSFFAFCPPRVVKTGDFAGESTSGRRRWQQRRGKGKHGGGNKGRTKKTANRFDLPV